jgi:hypothetical protein
MIRPTEDTYNRDDFGPSRNSIFKDIHEAVIWSHNMACVRNTATIQQLDKFFTLERQMKNEIWL